MLGHSRAAPGRAPTAGGNAKWLLCRIWRRGGCGVGRLAGQASGPDENPSLRGEQAEPGLCCVAAVMRGPSSPGCGRGLGKSAAGANAITRISSPARALKPLSPVNGREASSTLASFKYFC
ncbi:hypothetical protein [Lysobacter gummosus]|uniref:hypothetical protein n=1 Tax=Lysobacter gummosus TaxID=262324 RepID=UPI00363E1E78